MPSFFIFLLVTGLEVSRRLPTRQQVADRSPSGFLRSDELSKKPFARTKAPSPCLPVGRLPGEPVKSLQYYYEGLFILDPKAALVSEEPCPEHNTIDLRVKADNSIGTHLI